jgi:ABC-2 type transport system permease protein
MRRVLFLARADLVKALRAREVLVWTFAMPIVFFFFFSRMGGGAGSGAGDRLRLESAGPGGVVAEELERRLVEEDFVLERPAPAAEGEEDPRRVLEVPADLTARALAGETTTLRLRRSSEGFSADFDDARVYRALYTVLLDLAVLRAEGASIEPAAFARLREAPRALSLAVTPAGLRRTPPSGKQQSIPGTMVMFTLILLLTGGSVPVVLERRAGLLRRLASTPIARGEIVAGRWLSNFVLGLIQLAWALVIGTLLFDMDWGPHPLAVGLVLVPWAGLCSGFALVLSSLARSEGQVVGIGVLASNLLAALGGCWWPMEIAPGWMQDLARLLPTGWIMEALHALINFQRAPLSVWPQALALALGTLVATWIGARLFRYE